MAYSSASRRPFLDNSVLRGDPQNGRGEADVSVRVFVLIQPASPSPYENNYVKRTASR